jgi:LysR family cys regulon transcriptional activator
MKLQQLRFVREVVRAGFNVSAAAEELHTAQPGVSNQIQLLEQELNVQIFERKGKRLMGLTKPGQAIVTLIEGVLRGVDNIRQAGADFSNETGGTLSIATTHNQARYALPAVIKAFIERFPKVRLDIHQGNPTQVVDMALSGAADIAIATEAIELFPELVMLPCYEWNRCVVVPQGHPLVHCQPLSLKAIADYPIVTYDFAFAGRSKINKAFEAEGLKPNVVLTAIDSDVIKTYVELGLGVGILAKMAYDPKRDAHLAMLDAAHLFEPSMTRIGIRRGTYLRGFAYAFIELFAPHLDRKTVDAAMGEKL